MIARLGMALAVLAAPAGAEDNGRASDRALAPLVACRMMPDPRARAACYDAALDRLQQAVAARQVVVMDREQVHEDRRAMFGFNSGDAPSRLAIVKPPKAAKASRAARGAPATEEVEEVDSTLVGMSPFGYDRWTIRIATGAVWRTTEPGFPVALKPGTEVHIRRGIMGSYIVRIGKARPLKAMRVG